jgi:8-amino-7-oxononanoate synthase
MEVWFKEQLKARKEKGLYRRLKVNQTGVDFASNDYLGFAKRNWNHEAYGEEERLHGATGSRLLTGNSVFAEQLEREIANYHKQPAALLFNNGYMANLALFSTLPQRNDTVLLDEFAHASMIDGSKLSKATVWKFKHNSADALETKLKRCKGRAFIGLESVYSMSGESPVLDDFIYLAGKYDAALIADEAHAVGIMGDRGEGNITASGRQAEVLATVVTFGKAMGSHGAAVLGTETLRDYLINFARPLIYSTALPVQSLYPIRAAYAALENSGKERKALQEVVAYFREKIKQSRQSSWRNGIGPVQSLVLGDSERCKQMALNLQSEGFVVYPILYPTVKKDEACLRFSLHSYNTKEEVDQLFEALKRRA